MSSYTNGAESFLLILFSALCSDVNGPYLLANRDETVSHNRSNTPHPPCQNLMDTLASTCTHKGPALRRPAIYSHAQRQPAITVNPSGRTNRSRECVFGRGAGRKNLLSLHFVAPSSNTLTHERSLPASAASGSCHHTLLPSRQTISAQTPLSAVFSLGCVLIVCR